MARAMRGRRLNLNLPAKLPSFRVSTAMLRGLLHRYYFANKAPSTRAPRVLFGRGINFFPLFSNGDGYHQLRKRVRRAPTESSRASVSSVSSFAYGRVLSAAQPSVCFKRSFVHRSAHKNLRNSSRGQLPKRVFTVSITTCEELLPLNGLYVRVWAH